MSVQEISGLEINHDTVARLKQALERAEQGKIHDVVIVGSSRFEGGKGGYFSYTDMDDLVRLLGYLEYCKLAVHRAISDGTGPLL